jgi:formate hydrogenlyase subunit 6/NADH:ubiquinone oxidoreductase subunit I
MNISMLTDLLSSAFHRPITERYPVERRPTPARFRGLLHWNPDACTGCGLCVKDCPAEAIELVTIDKASKRFVLRCHVDRCTFCGQCAYSCRFNCIELSTEEWELADLDRRDFTIEYGKSEDINYLTRAEPEEAILEPAGTEV